MKELPEAKLWYNLLDERYGEDECTFYLFCLRVLEGIAGDHLHWGSRSDITDFVALQQRIKVQTEEAEASGDGPSASDMEPQTLWVDVRFTGMATEHVLSKATEEEQQLVIKKAMERAMDAMCVQAWIRAPIAPGGVTLLRAGYVVASVRAARSSSAAATQVACGWSRGSAT